jgi:hypothetical protein
MLVAVVHSEVMLMQTQGLFCSMQPAHARGLLRSMQPVRALSWASPVNALLTNTACRAEARRTSRTLATLMKITTSNRQMDARREYLGRMAGLCVVLASDRWGANMLSDQALEQRGV